MSANNTILKSLISAILFAFQALLISTHAQILKDEKDLKFENLPVVTILDSLSLVFEVNFSYNADLEFLHQEKSLQKKCNLEIALQCLLKGSNLEYAVQGKQIVLFAVLHTTRGIPLVEELFDYKVVVGSVLNKLSREPLAFASVGVFGTSLSTVTNELGGFKLKIPFAFLKDSLYVGYIGYASAYLPVDSLIFGDTLIILLNEVATYIEPVKIRPVSAESIVKEAIQMVSKNYSRKNAMYSAFYRETSQSENTYLSVSEALLDIAKAPYGSSFFNDQARIFRGRKKQDFTRLKNLAYKLEGGVYNSLRLDVVKEEAAFFSEEGLKWYRYHIGRTIQYNGRSLYAIEFESLKNIEDVSYQGVMYIDVEKKALVAVKFEMSPEGLKYARTLLIKKQPRKSQIKPVAAKYIVLYRYFKGKYYLEYTRADLLIKAKSERLFVNDKFQAIAELLVTQIDTTNTGRFKRSEIAKPSDIFQEHYGVYDESFWGGFNTLSPEIQFSEAIEKIELFKKAE